MPHTPFKLLAIAFLSSNALAQTPPDAGALMRQTEQTLQFEQMQRNAQRREALPPAMRLTDSTVVTPKSIKFLGAKRLTNDQLQATAAPFVGRELNAHELEHLTEAVVQTYRRAGWVVRVYVPQQDLSQSELSIQILENIPPSAR